MIGLGRVDSGKIDHHPAPAISVIMPVYNRAGVVGRAIASVLSQTFASFELIVIDDGSTDGTACAVEAIADERLRLIRQPRNAGGNAARNRGILSATAPLLSFLDSDDRFLEDKLATVVAAFAERRGLDLLIDSYVKTYEGAARRGDAECRNPRLETNGEVLEALFTRRIWKATPGISVRRDAVIRAGLFAEGLERRQDFDFILRVAAVGTVATSDRILWVKSTSGATISANPSNFMSATLEFYRRHPEYYDHPAYRRGFAHDVGRHFVRLARKGRFSLAARDARQCAGELGARRFLALLTEGAWRFRQRRRTLRGPSA